MSLSETEFSNQLSIFVQDWKSLKESHSNELSDQKIAEKLNLFFKKWTNLPTIKEPQEKPLYVDYVGLEGFFQNFDKAAEPIREARKNGLVLNVWQAAGLKTNEVRNSQVLKWLLDWRGDHGQGNKILVELLKLLPPRFCYEPKSYSIIAECCPLGNIENRVDIEIDAPEFLLFVEVKINALEGKEQLKRYYREAMLKTKNVKKDWGVIYLTKTGYLSTTEHGIKTALLNDNNDITKLIHDDLRNDTQQRLIPMSWSDISKLLYQYAVQANVNNRGAWLAKQFADHNKTF